MKQGRFSFSTLVEIADAVDFPGSEAPGEAFVNAVGILQRAVGAKLAPSYLLDVDGNHAVLVSDQEHWAILGKTYPTIVAAIHVQPPWTHPEGRPVAVADHINEKAYTRLPESFRDWFDHTGLCVPVHANRRHLGAILMTFDQPFDLTQAASDFLTAAGHILGAALYRWQVAKRQRELGALEERRLLADELHIDLSQHIAALGLHVGAMRLDLDQARAGSGLDQLEADVDRLDDMVGLLRSSLRQEMLGLRADVELLKAPYVLGLSGEAELIDEPLHRVVRRHVRNFEKLLGIPVELDFARPDEIANVPLAVVSQFIRVLQEALANTRLHSEATRLVIRLAATRDQVRLEIQDNGRGFDPAVVPESRLGLSIMRERIEQVGGTLEIDTAVGQGTRVLAVAPLVSVSGGMRVPLGVGV
ncbi:MAG: hypothetical protein LBR19_07885 [Bifidobacteriaceae bacterium]|jgi:NarL family two-component system sensor histidine kinase LiaS|nr:hypothetical protein [Bifidobacteriaceae bacterium]